MRDLLVLCPDVRWHAVLEAILPRWQSLGLGREISFLVEKSVGHRDGGVRKHGPELVSFRSGDFRYVLIVLDRRGCGDQRDTSVVEKEMLARLERSWPGRADVFVVDPDVEAWMLGAHSHYSRVRGLEGRNPRAYWEKNGVWMRNEPKPRVDTKEAVEGFFRSFYARPTAANYRLIAERASLALDGCYCESFHRFVQRLRMWFGDR